MSGTNKYTWENVHKYTKYDINLPLLPPQKKYIKYKTMNICIDCAFHAQTLGPNMQARNHRLGPKTGWRNTKRVKCVNPFKTHSRKEKEREWEKEVLSVDDGLGDITVKVSIINCCNGEFLHSDISLTVYHITRYLLMNWINLICTE